MKTEAKIKISKVTEPSATTAAPSHAPSSGEGQDEGCTEQPPRTRRAPRRRMRRSSRSCTSQQPQFDPANPQNPVHTVQNASSSLSAASASSASSPSPSRRRVRRASPFQPLPELAHLSADDLAEIHNTLRDLTVPEVAQFIVNKHSRFISHHRLYRYRERLDLADQLQIAEDNAPAIQNLLSMLAGKHVDLDRAGIHIIKQRAVTLAASPDSSASLLKDLFRIFTYKDRLALQQRRVKCQERMTKVAEKRQKLAEKIQREKDDAMGMEEQSAAVRELFGAFPPPIPFLPKTQNTAPEDIDPNTNGTPVDPNDPVLP
ncbi:MAG: hypothetical protein ACXW3Z_09215 [Limisphaerales bacterium]